MSGHECVFGVSILPPLFIRCSDWTLEFVQCAIFCFLFFLILKFIVIISIICSDNSNLGGWGGGVGIIVLSPSLIYGFSLPPWYRQNFS